MANRIFLVFPPGPFIDYAKAALEAVIGLLKKAIIRQGALEATQKVHARDLGKHERTKKGIKSDTVPEDCGNPLAGKVGTATELAQDLQIGRVALVLDRWLLSRSVIDSPV